MGYDFLNYTKLAAAKDALKARGGDLEDIEAVKAEYLKLGGVVYETPEAGNVKFDLPLDRLTKEEVAKVREMLEPQEEIGEEEAEEVEEEEGEKVEEKKVKEKSKKKK